MKTLYRIDLVSLGNDKLGLACDAYKVVKTTKNRWFTLVGRNPNSVEPNAPERRFNVRESDLTDRGFTATKVQAVEEYVKRRCRQHYRQLYVLNEHKRLGELTEHALTCLTAAANLLADLKAEEVKPKRKGSK